MGRIGRAGTVLSEAKACPRPCYASLAKPVTSSDGKSATTPSATAVDEANGEGAGKGQPSTDNCQSPSEAAAGSEANGDGTGNRQSANPESRTSDSTCSDTTKMTEQTEYSVENKDSAPENKAETNGEGQ
jgi:hypothetical protein